MITSQKLSTTEEFVVERRMPSDRRWAVITRATPDYDTARAWAHQSDTRVVMVQTRRFVCEDGE